MFSELGSRSSLRRRAVTYEYLARTGGSRLDHSTVADDGHRDALASVPPRNPGIRGEISTGTCVSSFSSCTAGT